MNQIVICSHKTSIPDLKEKLEQWKKELGPKRLEKMVLRQQIITTRLFYEKYQKGYTIEGLDKLSYLRQQFQKIR